MEIKRERREGGGKRERRRRRGRGGETQSKGGYDFKFYKRVGRMGHKALIVLVWATVE